MTWIIETEGADVVDGDVYFLSQRPPLSVLGGIHIFP
jgi:hypothetical protein